VKDSIPHPLSRAGVALKGSEIVDVLQRLCEEMAEWAAPLINAEGIYTSVVRARLDRIADEAKELYTTRQKEQGGSLEVSAVEAFKNSRREALEYFDTEAAYICSSLRDDVRNALESRLSIPEEEIKRGEERLAWAVVRTIEEALRNRAPDWASKFLMDPVCSGSREAQDKLRKLVMDDKQRALATRWRLPRPVVLALCLSGCSLLGIATTRTGVLTDVWTWTLAATELSTTSSMMEPVGPGHEIDMDLEISSAMPTSSEAAEVDLDEVPAPVPDPQVEHAHRRDGSLEAFFGIFEPSFRSGTAVLIGFYNDMAGRIVQDLIPWLRQLGSSVVQDPTPWMQRLVEELSPWLQQLRRSTREHPISLVALVGAPLLFAGWSWSQGSGPILDNGDQAI